MRVRVYSRRMARAPKKQAKSMAEGTLATRLAARWSGTGEEIALDRLVSEHGDQQRYDIVAALKELEKAGAGTFEVGRAGRKARFSWGNKPLKLAVEKKAPEKAPAKTPAKRTAVAPEPQRLQLSQRVKLAADSKPTRPQASSSELEHSFHLRPGIVVSVRLPTDVTNSEVTRFCQFLQAIPFAR